MPTTLQFIFPTFCLAALLFGLPTPAAAQQPACCSIAKNRGQQAFDKKDYATAIRIWTDGKGCPDAAKCPDLDALIKKAKDAQAAAAKLKRVTPAPKPQPQGPTEAERQAQAADQAAKAAFDMAKGINTIQAYEMFLGNHGSSRYAAEARRLKKNLEDAAKQPPPQQQPSTQPTPSKPSLPAPIARLEADMVRVEGGSFTMGCQSAARDGECYDDEKPPRQVRVSTFSIGKYEVTQAQWRAIMGSDPPELAFKGCDDCPVERVSWNDIQDFLKKLNAQTGKRYRLPTEAEWEYAARGGAQSRGYLYSGSNTIDEVAWYTSNSGNKTRPVGGKKPNELGLYDMSGNVWEWCEDDWHGSYNGAPTDGRAWVDSPRASYRVLRGGGWDRDPLLCRAAYRFFVEPTLRRNFVGFRLAL